MKSMIDRWRPRAPDPANAEADDQARRQLLAQALRETLRRNGIPSHWLGMEMLPALSRERGRGMHLRIVLRDWQPRLLEYMVALQHEVVARLLVLDAQSPAWLVGVSWSLEVDPARCPSLPRPNHWEPAAQGPAPRAAIGALLRPDRAFARDAHAATDFVPTTPMEPHLR